MKCPGTSEASLPFSVTGLFFLSFSQEHRQVTLCVPPSEENPCSLFRLGSVAPWVRESWPTFRTGFDLLLSVRGSLGWTDRWKQHLLHAISRGVNSDQDADRSIYGKTQGSGLRSEAREAPVRYASSSASRGVSKSTTVKVPKVS